MCGPQLVHHLIRLLDSWIYGGITQLTSVHVVSKGQNEPHDNVDVLGTHQHL